MKISPSPFAPQEHPLLPPVPGVALAAAATCMRYKGRDDLLLVRLDKGGCAAGSFTKSYTAASCVRLCKDALESGEEPRLLIVNAGNANACTGERGRQSERNIVAAAAKAFDVAEKSVYRSATGVIGDFLKDGFITDAIPALKGSLSEDFPWLAAAKSIMTTDTYPKLAHRSVKIDGVDVTFNGFAKGSGMIAPDMATMLAFVFTDLHIDASLWRELHREATFTAYNAITVDGDSSTNDAALAFATRKAGHTPILSAHDPRYGAVREAVQAIHRSLALQIVEDGEGITKRIAVTVAGARTDEDARTLAMSVANSPLVKTAIFGCDPNWGRVMMAIGKAGVPFREEDVSLSLGAFKPVEKGVAADVDLKGMSAYFRDNRYVDIDVSVGGGPGKYTAWTCDFSYDYVRINAEYRS